MKKIAELHKLIRNPSTPKQEPKTSIEIPTILKEVSQAKLQLTTLKNGVRILTESSTFPGNIIIGAAFKSGTRNEPFPETLRSLSLLHNLTLPSHSSDYLQQLGSDISISFDEELTSFHTESLSHNIKKLSSILYPSIFPQFESSLQSILQKKLKHSLNSPTNFLEVTEKSLVFHAFQRSVKGNSGAVSVGMLNSHIQDFHNSGNLCVFANGINSHFEFVDLVSEHVRDLPETEELAWEPLKFEGKVVNVSQNLPFGCYSMCVPGEAWGAEDFWAQKLLSELVPYAFNELQSSYPYISEVFSNTFTLSDNGLFIISFFGPPEYLSKSQSLFSNLLEKMLKIIPDYFETIKQQSKLNFFLLTENHEKRLLRTVKKFLLTKKLNDSYSEFSEIDSVKIEDLDKLIQKFMKIQPLYLNIGPGFSR